MRKKIVVTGATGAVGQHALAVMRQQFGDARFVLITRNPSAVPAAPNIEAVRGDLAAEGPESADVVAALRGATHVVHMAADVRWDQRLERAMATNVNGTERLLRGSEAMAPDLERFVYVSTAYAATPGRCSLCKPLYEDKGRQFNNSYEYSKRTAEELVEKSALPWSIVRPSLVVGARNDGSIGRYNGMYGLLKYAARGMLPLLVGAPSAYVDLVPVDVLAEAILDAMVGARTLKRRVWACSADSSSTVKELVHQALGSIDVYRSRLSLPSIGRPAIVDCERYHRLYYPFIAPELTGDKRRLLGLLGLLGIFHPYLSVPNPFSISADDVHHRAPPLGDYLDGVVQAWCRNSHETATSPPPSWWNLPFAAGA
jgi:nucleoside-diphosphate-sugar epimerase